MSNYTPFTRNASVFVALAQGLPEAPLSHDDRTSVRFLQQEESRLGGRLLTMSRLVAVDTDRMKLIDHNTRDC